MSVLAAIVAELRAHPEIVAEIRELFIAPAAKPEAETVYERVPAFAARVAISERSAWNLVKLGLPCIGERRGRRVVVAEALAWMRDRKNAVDDSIAKSARASARRAASRGSR